jgi:hypothetical protein
VKFFFVFPRFMAFASEPQVLEVGVCKCCGTVSQTCRRVASVSQKLEVGGRCGTLRLHVTNLTPPESCAPQK